MLFLDKIKKFYNASAENKTQLHIFLGFLVIPFFGMIILFIYVCTFYFSAFHYDNAGRLSQSVNAESQPSSKQMNQ